MLLALVAGAMLAAGPARADVINDALAFRALGWYKGKGEITAGQIKCEIPTVESAIAEGAFALGLWNTFGVPTIYYPDINSPFGNPCGVWIQLQSNLRDQGLQLDRIQLQFRVRGARRYRQFVPTRNKFPLACREFRKEVLFLGTRLNPVNSTESTSSSGLPNVAFVELLPLVSPQLISCLRDQYAPLSTELFTSLPLAVRATAVAVSDAGETYQSNTIQYTLNLRHTCGNGRVDDGEQCDPLAPTTCLAFCKIESGRPFGECSNDPNHACRSDAECVGVCLDGNTPTECTCVY